MPKIPEDDKQQKKKFRLEDIFGFFSFQKNRVESYVGDLNAPLGILFFTSRNCGCSHSGRGIVTLAAPDSS